MEEGGRRGMGKREGRRKKHSVGGLVRPTLQVEEGEGGFFRIAPLLKPKACQRMSCAATRRRLRSTVRQAG